MEPASVSVTLITDAHLPPRIVFLKLRKSAVGNADKYRANAHYCRRMADKSLTLEEKLNWLNMAETWLGDDPRATASARGNV
jgi:hypothetical protein